MQSTFEDAQKRLTEVFKHIALTDDVQEKLQHPNLSLAVSIPIRMDDGRLKVFSPGTESSLMTPTAQPRAVSVTILTAGRYHRQTNLPERFPGTGSRRRPRSTLCPAAMGEAQ